MDQTLARDIFNACHRTGHFVLRSGRTSTEYFDKYRFESDPRLLARIARAMKPLIPTGTEVLSGLEMGGIPIATALALETGLPLAFVRKAAKDYGTMQLAEGPPSLNGKRVLVIEDVVTTGGQVVKSVADLRALGAGITRVLCVIDRQQGGAENLSNADLSLDALFTAERLRA